MKRIFFLAILMVTSPLISNAQNKVIAADHPLIDYLGTIDFTNKKEPSFAWPGISIRGRFTGNYFEVRLRNIPTTTDPASQANYYYVFIDDSLYQRIRAEKSKSSYVISNSLSLGEHSFEIYKLTESIVGTGVFEGLVIADNGKLLPFTSSAEHRIEFIGNSITCGYGVDGLNRECKFSDSTENNYKSYAAIAARELRADAHFTAYSGKGIYQNYNQDTGLTMYDLFRATFPNRPSQKTVTRDWNPDLVVINLGTNDFSHVNPDSLLWTHRCIAFLDSIRIKYDDVPVVLCVSQMMSDYWPQGNNARTTIKNYLNGVLGVRTKLGDSAVYLLELSKQGGLGYGCDWHPSYRQNQLNAKELVGFIKENLDW